MPRGAILAYHNNESPADIAPQESQAAQNRAICDRFH
jgi:hypothetical protein